MKKLAIIGYGRMGKIIETLAPKAGFEVGMIIDADNRDDLASPAFQEMDVAVEFTRPESAFGNIKACLEAGVPVVSGTTAWLERLEEVENICDQTKGAFFYASNFSIGVNIFFALNKYLARLMNAHPLYQVQMEELHHTGKLDAPSGTAITLAEDILEELDRKQSWVNDENAELEELSIISKRVDPLPGTHKVEYSSAVDSIRMEHEAFTREGFARGALAAASWIIGRQGVFGMEDMLGLGTT